MVCRNPGPRLIEAVDSVRHQREADTEIVLIDGASTDGTREWLEANRSSFAVADSAPDHGIYDAMNKALRSARGDWILFLGADDRLASDDVLNRAGTALSQSPADIVSGTARFDDGRVYPARPDAAIRRNFLHHQATFYRRRLLDRHGPFDTSLRLQADYDLNLRMLRAGARVAPLPILVALCASGGASDAGHWTNYREEITVRHRHYPIWRCLPWDGLAVLRFLRKRMVRRQR